MPEKHLNFKTFTCYGAEWHLDWHQTLLIQNPEQRTRVYMIDNTAYKYQMENSIILVQQVLHTIEMKTNRILYPA